MSDILRSLLAADGLAQQAGIALKPELRAALQAELRFPAKSSGPMQSQIPHSAGDNVIPLPVARDHSRRSG